MKSMNGSKRLTQNPKALKKKTSLEWLTEKFAPKKNKGVRTSNVATAKKKKTSHSVTEPCVKIPGDAIATDEGLTSPVATSTGCTRQSQIGDVGEWNNFLKSEGIVKAERKVERLDLEDFEYRVFHSHLLSMASAVNPDGVDVDTLAVDIVKYGTIKDLEEAKQFCLQLDENAPATGVVVEKNIALLGNDILVNDDNTQAIHERQLKLRYYIRAVNEQEIQALLNKSSKLFPRNAVDDNARTRRTSLFFTVAHIKKIITGRRNAKISQQKQCKVIVFCGACSA